MITEDCTRLRTLMEGLATAEQNEELVKGLQERKRELEVVRDKIKSAAERVKPLNSRDIEFEKPPTSERDKAQVRLAKMSEVLASEPKDITKGRDFTTLRKGLEKLADEMLAMADVAWEPYAKREQPNVDKAQLEQCRRSHAAAVGEIEDLASTSKRMARRVPASEEDLSRLESKWERIRELVRSLPKASSDPAVIKFIDAANESGGAELNLLTSEVLKWLKDEGMLDKFRIVSN